MTNIKGSDMDKDKSPLPTPKVELYGRNVYIVWMSMIAEVSFILRF